MAGENRQFGFGGCGFGGFFGYDVILWFIILFLLLFWGPGFGIGPVV